MVILYMRSNKNEEAGFLRGLKKGREVYAFFTTPTLAAYTGTYN